VTHRHDDSVKEEQRVPLRVLEAFEDVHGMEELGPLSVPALGRQMAVFTACGFGRGDEDEPKQLKMKANESNTSETKAEQVKQKQKR
jgi:hypothetical protein